MELHIVKSVGLRVVSFSPFFYRSSRAAQVTSSNTPVSDNVATVWRSQQNFLLAAAFVMPLTFSVWQALLNNFVIERAVFTGAEPKAIDAHCHFGRSTLFAPELDLHRSSPRVQHLLDCDEADPDCELDLDVYINRNFDEEALADLRWGVASSMLWGSTAEETHTIPNLLAEMDATGVEQAVILPIAFGLPFGDDLTERWMEAIVQSGNTDHFIPAASVHPRDSNRIEKLRRFSAAGARVVKLHTMQRFYPDGDDMTEYYRECERLNLVLFFHCGRAGIEPESMHRYALPRHFEAAIRAFPKLQFVLGHSGARDVAQAIPLAERYDNVWLGASCQGVTMLNEMLDVPVASACSTARTGLSTILL